MATENSTETVPEAVKHPRLGAAQKQLAEVWRSWSGQVSDRAERDRAKATLPVILQELDSGKKNAAPALRLVQFLLADSGVPDTHRRPSMQALLRRFDVEDQGLGERSDDLRYLQAALIAAWPDPCPDVLTQVAACFQSAAGLMPRAVEEAGALRDLRTRIEKSVEQAEPATDLLVRLLYWGQAGYCRAHGRPYWQIRDPDERLYLAAGEVPSYSLTQAKGSMSLLALRPVAAYLCNVLRCLDASEDLAEQKPLIEWLARLHQALASTREPPILPLADTFAGLVAEDSLGLPVSRVHLAVSKHTALPPLDELSRQIGVTTLEAPCSRGDFIELVLRERVLERRIAGAT